MWLLENLKLSTWLTLSCSWMPAGLDCDSDISPLHRYGCKDLCVNNCPLLWAHFDILLWVHKQSCGSLSYSGSLSLPHRPQPNSFSQIEPLNPLLWFLSIPRPGGIVSGSASASPCRTLLCLFASATLSCLVFSLPF